MKNQPFHHNGEGQYYFESKLSQTSWRHKGNHFVNDTLKYNFKHLKSKARQKKRMRGKISQKRDEIPFSLKEEPFYLLVVDSWQPFTSPYPKL